jgi:hypothetical protein
MKERPEDVVHQRLEGSQGIGEAKWHHQELIMALMCAESHLADVVGCIRT